MFAMFGAVPRSVLIRINPAIVLFMKGSVGTLMFIFITKGKAPAYPQFSFAFLAPAIIVIAKFGYEYAAGDSLPSVSSDVSSRSSFASRI